MAKKGLALAQETTCWRCSLSLLGERVFHLPGDTSVVTGSLFIQPTVQALYSRLHLALSVSLQKVSTSFQQGWCTCACVWFWSTNMNILLLFLHPEQELLYVWPVTPFNWINLNFGQFSTKLSLAMVGDCSSVIQYTGSDDSHKSCFPNYYISCLWVDVQVSLQVWNFSCWQLFSGFLGFFKCYSEVSKILLEIRNHWSVKPSLNRKIPHLSNS